MLLCRNLAAGGRAQHTCDFRTQVDDSQCNRGERDVQDDLFKGKRFLVTGGGTGLGRIMMERFVELGADCVICGRRGSVLEETARQVMAKYPAAGSIPIRSISGWPRRSRR
jgi:hypothetical protein